MDYDAKLFTRFTRKEGLYHNGVLVFCKMQIVRFGQAPEILDYAISMEKPLLASLNNFLNGLRSIFFLILSCNYHDLNHMLPFYINLLRLSFNGCFYGTQITRIKLMYTDFYIRSGTLIPNTPIPHCNTCAVSFDK